MKVLVLEDTPARVSWLRSILGLLVDIVHADNVDTFVSLADGINASELVAVILDHDLPLGAPDVQAAIGLALSPNLNDAQDQNGQDAARKMRLFAEVPHLIWSCNETGAKRIRMILLQRGVLHSQWIPYYEQNYPVIVEFIIRALRLHKSKKGS